MKPMSKNSISYKYIFLTILLSFSCLSSAETDDSYLTLALGHVAVFDSDVNDPGVAKIEYRFAPTDYWGLAPAIGFARSQGSASFAFAFLEKDFEIYDNWIIALNFGVGSFTDGEDVKLGKTLEFRSGVRFLYEFDNNMRFGLELFHLSNGGLGDLNPGTEPAFITLQIPF